MTTRTAVRSSNGVASRAQTRSRTPVANSNVPGDADSRPVGAEAFGALDLGTNNCRLLIARERGEGGGFQVLDSFSKITRLGEGIQTEGRLSESAMERTIGALQVCSERLRRNRVTHMRCVTTAACRIASNADVFIRRVQEETGLKLEIITAEEEARLTLYGCLPLLSGARPYTLLFDIGGGSTELTLAEVTPTPDGPVLGAIRAMESLPFGVVTMAEAVGGGHLNARLHQDIVRYVTRRLRDFDPCDRLRLLVARGELAMLGTSGTVTTAGAIVLDLPRYDRARVDGMTLDVARLRRVGERLLAMTPAQRIAHPCIGRERADLVLAGSAILEAIIGHWPVEAIRIADRGVREGLLVELIRGDHWKVTAPRQDDVPRRVEEPRHGAA